MIRFVLLFLSELLVFIQENTFYSTEDFFSPHFVPLCWTVSSVYLSFAFNVQLSSSFFFVVPSTTILSYIIIAFTLLHFSTKRNTFDDFYQLILQTIKKLKSNSQLSKQYCWKKKKKITVFKILPFQHVEENSFSCNNLFKKYLVQKNRPCTVV